MTDDTIPESPKWYNYTQGSGYIKEEGAERL